MKEKRMKEHSSSASLNSDSDFKARLRFYMHKSGFNPTSLSREAGLNATAVRDILEHEGIPSPRIDTFIKLCRALNITPDKLSPDIEMLCKFPRMDTQAPQEDNHVVTSEFF